MKLNTLIVSAFLLAGSPIVVEAHTLDLPITTSNEANKVAFRSVRVEHDPAGRHIIKGQLRRLGRDPIHFGHLDYQIRDPQGKSVETGQDNYTSAIRLRHAHRPSYFTINPEAALNDGYSVQLTWTPDPLHGHDIDPAQNSHPNTYQGNRS